ncbi:MAG: hypothetical protein KDJ80_14065 [Nitratireductor sp.]|nr:hypothetical protein [Nitratireductor sp.]
MDIYQGFFTLKPGANDLEFAADFEAFMQHLAGEGKIAGWRLMRRKLGLGPAELGDWHMMIEVEDLAQLDAAFSLAARRSGDTEQRHFAVNSKIASVKFALYRDFPDSQRRTGEELF